MAIRLHAMTAMASTLGGPLLDAVAALQVEAFARRYYDLFNERRLDEAERFVHPQAVFTYPSAREHFIGRAGYRELTRRWIEAFPDAHLSITRVRVSGQHAAETEWLGEGTHLGTIELPGLPVIPPTGVHARLPMRETIRLEGGLIVESRMEYDPAELRRALGL